MYNLSLCLLLGNIRISDLGLAVELNEGQDKTKGYAGTPGKTWVLGEGPGEALHPGRGLGYPVFQSQRQQGPQDL